MRTLKIIEVAKLFQVDRRTVLSWIESGELTAVDVRPHGSSRALWRIRADDLEDFSRRRLLDSMSRMT